MNERRCDRKAPKLDENLQVSINPQQVIPLLALLKKFFVCVAQVSVEGQMVVFRGMKTRDQIVVSLNGFTPVEFNMLQSLVQTVGTNMAADLREITGVDDGIDLVLPRAPYEKLLVTGIDRGKGVDYTAVIDVMGELDDTK